MSGLFSKQQKKIAPALTEKPKRTKPEIKRFGLLNIGFPEILKKEEKKIRLDCFGFGSQICSFFPWETIYP